MTKVTLVLEELPGGKMKWSVNNVDAKSTEDEALVAKHATQMLCVFMQGIIAADAALDKIFNKDGSGG